MQEPLYAETIEELGVCELGCLIKVAGCLLNRAPYLDSGCNTWLTHQYRIL